MRAARLPVPILVVLAIAPLGGCAQLQDLLAFGPKPPAMDSQGRRLSRGIVVSVRNVKAAAPKPIAPAVDDKSKGKSKTGDQAPRAPASRYALEYRILQDDGETLVVVTQGGADDAIGPGQRVLVVHGDQPRVMLETPLAEGQGV